MDNHSIFCVKCGALLEEGSQFCTSCGHNLSEGEDATLYATVRPTPAVTTAVAVPPAAAVTTAVAVPPAAAVTTAVAAPPPQPPLYQGTAPATVTAPKKSPLPLILSIVAGVILACGIGIAVFFMMTRSNNGSSDSADAGYLSSNDGRDIFTGDSPSPSPDNSIPDPPPPGTPKPDQNPTPQPTTAPTPTPPPTPVYIENPQIIITTRYNPSTGAFNAQDEHAASVRSAGGIPVLPGDDRMLAEILRTGDTTNADAIADLYDGLILTGGGDISARFFNQTPHPASGTPDEIRDTAEIALCRAFINAGKPILGINRGMQVLNVTMGGDLYQDIPDLLGLPDSTHSGNNTHTISIERGTWLYDLFGSSLLTYSAHHQALNVIARGFTIAASAGVVVEAIENGNFLGIQFNPERLEGNGSSLIFTDFITRCSYPPVR